MSSGKNINSNKIIKSRRALDVRTKKAIIELSEQGIVHRIIAERFGLGRSTVTKILLSKEKILENDLGILTDSKKRIKNDKLHNLEVKLVKWCVDEAVLKKSEEIRYGEHNPYFPNPSVDIRVDLDANAILAKANELAAEMGLFEFEGTLQWLSKFRSKFNLSFELNLDEPSSSPKISALRDQNEISNFLPQAHIVKSNVSASIDPRLLLSNHSASTYTNFFPEPVQHTFEELNTNNRQYIINANTSQTNSSELFIHNSIFEGESFVFNNDAQLYFNDPFFNLNFEF